MGHVTPQHVGRLRRAFERFDAVREDYPGLYWSHFQAALDWDDAEMWLEGAVQSDWSIADMRHKRWETLGGGQATDEAAEDEAAAPWDDDADGADDSGEVAGGTLGVVRVPDRTAADDAGDVENAHAEAHEGADDDYDAEDVADEGAPRLAVEPFRPFADLASLPADVSDAFEAFKLCILRHKLAGWQEISREDLLASLDALKELCWLRRNQSSGGRTSGSTW